MRKIRAIVFDFYCKLNCVIENLRTELINRIQAIDFKTAEIVNVDGTTEMYLLTQAHNGKVIVIHGGSTTFVISLDASLEVGFNATVISDTTQNVEIDRSFQPNTQHIDNNNIIENQYGSFSIVKINPGTSGLNVVSGDLTASTW